MTIDLHIWSSIAGYGSRKRCWLGDQKCGLFRMVVREHFKPSPPFHPSIFSLSRGLRNTWLTLILFHHDNLVGGFGRWLY